MHEAKTHLSQLLAEVERGESILITRRDEPVATLTAAKKVSKRRELGRGRGLGRIADDFDAPLPDFEEYER